MPGRAADVAGVSAIHMYRCIVDTMEALLKEKDSPWFKHIFHYLIRLEYQGRGTIHFHIAAWVILKHAPGHCAGRADNKDPRTSPFHSYLERLFRCHIDVQWTTGRLSYTNGYTTKAHDAMGFRLDSNTSYEGSHLRWLTVFRMLCRRTDCIPEVALWFYEAQPMIRSCRVWRVYAPIPWKSDDKEIDSDRLYEFYLNDKQLLRCSFLEYARIYKVKDGQLVEFEEMGKPTIAIGVRYGAPMKDVFLGQLAVMTMPHYSREQLQSADTGDTGFRYVRCLLGFLKYLASLVFCEDGTIRFGSGDYYASAKSFLAALPVYSPGPIFASRPDALRYIEHLACLDMTYRSLKHDRIQSALLRIRASYYLATGVSAPSDRDLWNKAASGTIREVTFSEDQKAGMTFFQTAMEVGNAEDHDTSTRRCYIVGKPGSGKTELFIQYCAYAIANRLRVLILCPTGQLVAAYRQRPPETESVRVDTIHSGLHIYREDEALVEHIPPSTLRLYDCTLIDECSQLDNDVAWKLKIAIAELPQNPLVAVAADFQQLQSIKNGGGMESWCKLLKTFTLNTIYRTSDPELLEFLSYARENQPTRSML